jgi:hypothetical protein
MIRGVIRHVEDNPDDVRLTLRAFRRIHFANLVDAEARP